MSLESIFQPKKKSGQDSEAKTDKKTAAADFLHSAYFIQPESVYYGTWPYSEYGPDGVWFI